MPFTPPPAMPSAPATAVNRGSLGCCRSCDCCSVGSPGILAIQLQDVKNTLECSDCDPGWNTIMKVQETDMSSEGICEWLMGHDDNVYPCNGDGDITLEMACPSDDPVATLFMQIGIWAETTGGNDPIVQHVGDYNFSSELVEAIDCDNMSVEVGWSAFVPTLAHDSGVCDFLDSTVVAVWSSGYVCNIVKNILA